jgi:hypothetical protein
MSKNKKDIYEGIPHEFYEGEMSDLGYKSGEELIEYALKRFRAAASKINIKVLGHDIDFPN